MKKKKILKYILASYIIIAMVPCIALGCFLFGFMNNFYIQEILTNRVTMLQMARKSIDLLIGEMYTNARQMLASNDFSTSHLQEAYGNMYDAMGQLYTLYATSDYLYDVLYFNEDLETIYTTETAFSYERFENYSKSAPAETDVKMRDIYLHNKYNYWIDEYGTDHGNHLIGYVVTNKRGIQIPAHSVTYTIETETLDSIFGNYIGNMNACVMLLDNDGKIIYTTESQFGQIAERLYAAEERPYDTLITLDSENEKYALYQAKSEKSSLTYAIMIPYDRIVQPLQTQMHIAVLVYTGVIILGIFSIIYFTKKMYTPIRTVSGLAQNALDDMSLGDMNEMEIAHQALLVMSNERRLKYRDKEFVAELNDENARWQGFSKENTDTILAVFRIFYASGAFIDADTYRELAEFSRRNISNEQCVSVAAFAPHKCICILLHEMSMETNETPQVILSQIRNLLEYTFGVKVCMGYSVMSGKTLKEAFMMAEAEAKHTEMLAETSLEETDKSDDERTFSDVMEYVLKNYSSPEFSAKSLASDMGMSLSNFSHYFKKNMGRTFSEYLSALRLEKAKNLLETTDFTLACIAERCGYLNASAFMRSFKKQVGITPSVYRNEYREQ